LLRVTETDHVPLKNMNSFLRMSMMFLKHDEEQFMETEKETQTQTLQYSTVQYSTVQYSTVQYSTVQYST
jgi:hypothetical protein